MKGMKAKKYFTLSFDDGTIQDIRLVHLFNKYGLKSTFNLNSGLFSQKHRIIHDGIDIDHSEITADMVYDLYKGHEIAVHTLTHPRLDKCDRDQIIREVGEDKAALETLCGYKIIGMAYPGGPFYNDFVIDTIRKNTGIVYARAVDADHAFNPPRDLMIWQPTCHQNDVKLFELADTFIHASAESEMLFYLWGHSFEFDKYNNWYDFECFCEKISGRRDIQYVTNAGYLYESNRLISPNML